MVRLKLSDHQGAFLLDVALLILWAHRQGYRVRAGDFWRSAEEQARLVAAGRSRVRHSRHQDRLAADLPLDKWDGVKWVYQRSTAAYRPLGEYWESLSPHNVWGGRWESFPDGNHFERRLHPRVVETETEVLRA